MEDFDVTQAHAFSNFKGLYGTVSKHRGERKGAA